MEHPSVFQDVSLTSLPAVVVFKDGTYLAFDGEGFSWRAAAGGLPPPAGGLQ